MNESKTRKLKVHGASALPLCLALCFLAFMLRDLPALGPFAGDRVPREVPGTSSGGFELVDAFPKQRFLDPIDVIQAPDGNNFVVVERMGRLTVLDRSGQWKTVVLDIQDQVENTGDSGMFSVVYHPEFGKQGSPNSRYIYVFYRYIPERVVVDDPLHEENAAYTRLSRFEWDGGTSWINPDTEFVLFNQFDRDNWHSGGGMTFAPDGFLYLTVGDEGGSHDPFETAQSLNGGLFGGILRIDVDQQGGSVSHPIRRQPRAVSAVPAGWPETYSQGYFIPNDNPWLDPNGGRLEEFWGKGLRMPFKMTYDPIGDRFWIGDVGQSTREEIGSVTPSEAGRNFGWPWFEGDVAGRSSKPNNHLGTIRDPVYSYGRDIGGCVVGGDVYYGDAFPQLEGKLIFGDYNSGRIMSLGNRPDGTWGEDLLALHAPAPQNKTGRISGFHTTGEGGILVSTLNADRKENDPILEIVGTEQAPEPPPTLFGTGLFENFQALTPIDGIVPYEPGSKLWSDGATKRRWIAVPEGEEVKYSQNGEWKFPIGTVTIKHFDFHGKKVETRIMAQTAEDEWYAVTYKWREDQSDADLVPDWGDSAWVQSGDQGIQWEYPSRTSCFTCHTPASGYVLGVKTRQLNRDYTYPSGKSANQVLEWSNLGILDTRPSNLSEVLTSYDILDPSVSAAQKARSYLDSNCAMCHRPESGAAGFAQFNALRTTPQAQMGIINAAPLAGDVGIPGGKLIVPGEPDQSILLARINSTEGCCQMPPLATSRVDEAAVSVVEEWILNLGGKELPSKPVDTALGELQDTVAMGGGWLWSEWTNFVQATYYPWIYSERGGWLYTRNEASGLFFYSINEKQWFWTTPQYGPLSLSMSSGAEFDLFGAP